MFNTNKIGKPLAKIIESDPKKETIISLDDKEMDNGFKKIILKKDEKIHHIPNTAQERDIVYICGASGSGKSTYAVNYIKNYKKAHPKNEVFIFSPVLDDKKMDDAGIKRVKIDQSLVTSPILPSDLENTCVIFDDIDCIGQKPLRDALYKLMEQILEVGRHKKITCIITNHLATNGKETRKILNEAHTITYFPASGSKKQIDNLLMNYVGMDQKDIKKAKKSGSRWVTIFKHYPQCVMTEKEMYLLNEE